MSSQIFAGFCGAAGVWLEFGRVLLGQGLHSHLRSSWRDCHVAYHYWAELAHVACDGLQLNDRIVLSIVCFISTAGGFLSPVGAKAGLHGQPNLCTRFVGIPSIKSTGICATEPQAATPCWGGHWQQRPSTRTVATTGDALSSPCAQQSSFPLDSSP